MLPSNISNTARPLPHGASNQTAESTAKIKNDRESLKYVILNSVLDIILHYPVRDSCRLKSNQAMSRMNLKHVTQEEMYLVQGLIMLTGETRQLTTSISPGLSM